MSVLVMDCPHCFATNATFKVVGSCLADSTYLNHLVFLMCPACFKGAVAHLELKRKIQNIAEIDGPIDHDQICSYIEVFPKPAPIEIPDHIPDNVARIFKQAVINKNTENLDAACSMYRKAMELALKSYSPDVEAWKLEKRIDTLASENRITPELQAWAHELRLDGNEALHSGAEPNEEMAEQMHGFCKFLLIYLYTLPEQVRAAKARRETQHRANHFTAE